MKITTLILSFIFAVCVLSAPVAVVQADEQTALEFSASFKMVNETERQPENEKKYSVNENGTGTIIVSTQWLVCL